jgi:hypothetical protein
MSMPAEKPKLYPINNDPGAVVKDIQENYSTGYINLFRSIRKHWVWQDAEKFKWWVDILLEANHKDQKVLLGGKLIECNRGQSVNSLLTWAKRWRTNSSAVRRFLKLLESDSMIVTENVSKTTRLTVCNYGSYNDKRNDDETIMKRKRNDDETDMKTNKNGNNGKNENKRRSANKFSPPSLDEVKEYFKAEGYSESSAKQAFELYNGANWHDTKGNKISNWKLKMQNVWFKEDNKSKSLFDEKLLNIR